MKQAALALALLLAGCGATLPSTPVAPPLPAERIPLPPVSEETLIWHPGDWTYVSGSYHYDPGHYESAGTHGTKWIPGHWVGTQGDGRWTPGAWEPK